MFDYELAEATFRETAERDQMWSDIIRGLDAEIALAFGLSLAGIGAFLLLAAVYIS